MQRKSFRRLFVALPLLLLTIPTGTRSQEIPKQALANAQAKTVWDWMEMNAGLSAGGGCLYGNNAA